MSLEQTSIAFSAGLMHDVGKIILLNAFPERYQSVLDQAHQTDRELTELEIEEFSASHQGVGGYLLNLWGLPLDVIKSVASHHSFETCALAKGEPSQVVFAANWLDHDCDLKFLYAMTESLSEAEEAREFVNQIAIWKTYLVEEEE